MERLPHRYFVSADARPGGDVGLTSPRVSGLASNSPAEFDGPGDRWSPETLLVGAVADCFILTFRAVARASRVLCAPGDAVRAVLGRPIRSLC